MAYQKGRNVILNSGVIIGDNVILEDDVYIDCNSIVRDNVHIKKGTAVGANCILGEHQMDFYEQRNEDNIHPLIIGEKSIIRSGTIIYGDTIIGDYFHTGHRVTIREKTVIGNHVSAGTLTDIQGHCNIGNYVRMHSNVHIGMQSTVEDFVWIYPYCCLTNDPTPPSTIEMGVILKSFSVVSTGSIILPGVVVEGDSLIAAGAIVTKDVKSNTVVGGNPAKVIGDLSRIKNKETGECVYPWRYTFERGMPWEKVGYENWVELENK